MMPLMARRLASVSAFSYCRRFRFFISLNTESATKRPRLMSNRRLSADRRAAQWTETRAWRADCLRLPSDNRRF
jgi:hypothetical protein